MKKLVLLSAICVLLLSAIPRGSLTGWTTSGSIQIVRTGGPGPSYGKFHAEGFGAGGTISQTLSVVPGPYVFVVWCNGSGVFNISQDGWSRSQTCDPASFWPSLVFVDLTLSSSPIRVSAQLKNGDGADQFCLYPIINGNGKCPPSVISNFSFESK